MQAARAHGIFPKLVAGGVKPAREIKVEYVKAVLLLGVEPAHVGFSVRRIIRKQLKLHARHGVQAA